MMAVTNFLRWPLERVFHGEECVVSAGSDGNMEFCSCSANSSKASGSVEAIVGSVDGKGEAESRMGSECSLWVVGSGSISSMVGSGAGEVVFVFHCLSGPKSVVCGSHCERWHDDLRGPSVWDAVDADGGLSWASGCRVVASGSFHWRDCRERRLHLRAAPDMTVWAQPFSSSTTKDVTCRESKLYTNSFCITDPTDQNGTEHSF